MINLMSSIKQLITDTTITIATFMFIIDRLNHLFQIFVWVGFIQLLYPVIKRATRNLCEF